ncbi:DoxX protein [Flavobacteriaceae bacterium MAR_2010_188]|nr:DoxX protein [Flavobacteriaceae bacterium MAR_2010_188]
MKNKILLIVGIVYGLIFINAGLNKFLNYMSMPEDLPQEAIDTMDTILKIEWLMPLIAVVEIVGGLLFMISKFRALGAVILFPIGVGIVMTHLINIPSGLPLALILFAVLLWVIYENRAKYTQMIT